MARLWSCGFELNSVTAGVEFDSNFNGTISSTNVRSGSHSYRVNPSASNADIGYTFSSAVKTITYYRFYLYVVSVGAVGASGGQLIQFSDGGGNTFDIRINTSLQLRVFNDVAAAQLGSTSAALTPSQWYRIEISLDYTTPSAVVMNAYIDGVIFATGTANQTARTGIKIISLGVLGGGNTCDMYFDDIAINDNSGSFQNGLPGAGSIYHLHPNGSGDSATFSVQTGGSTQWNRVSEITPDDVTTYNGSATLNQEDLFIVDNLPQDQTPALVQVGVRFRNNVADATTALKLEAMKISGGTKSQSAAIIPNSTTWLSNAIAAPQNYALTLYQDPDNINWTADTINSMQIGYLLSAAGVNQINVSTLWALVEYTPKPSNRIQNYGSALTVGDGMSRSEVAN